MSSAADDDLDWREMRARLVAQEKQQKDGTSSGFMYEYELLEQGTVLLGGTKQKPSCVRNLEVLEREEEKRKRDLVRERLRRDARAMAARRAEPTGSFRSAKRAGCREQAAELCVCSASAGCPRGRCRGRGGRSM